MSLARHTSYNVAGAIIPLALSLVLTPIFVSTIGLARYGLLSICWTLLGYFGLFDFGTGRAVAQRIATLKDDGKEARNRAFWTSLVVCLLLCTVAAAAMLLAGPLVIRFLGVKDQRLLAEFKPALVVLSFALPISILSNQVSGALEGAQRFGTVNAIAILSTALVIGLPLIVAIATSSRLDLMVGAATIGRLIGLAAYSVAAVLALPISAPRFDRRDVTHLFSFGGWSTLSNTLGPVMIMFDRFLIGRMLSPAAVGLYVLPFSLMSQLQIFPTALTRALFPTIASSTEKDAAIATGVAISFLNYVLTCALSIISLLILPFLCLWLGSETGKAASPVAYGLVVGIWANSLALVTAVKLQAQAKPRFLAIVHTAEVGPFLVALYFGVRLFGLPGAALAWSLRCLIDAVIIFGLQRVQLDVRQLTVNGIALAAITAISLLLPTNSPVRFASVAAIALGTTWQAWRQRPPSVRSLEARLLCVFRSVRWS